MNDGVVSELATGGRRPLARLLTRIENGDPSVRPLLPDLFAAGRGAHVVGITGPPGSGKSTLVNALITEWRKRGRRVGILAVDPSSPYTRGAILGDRIRMMDHAADRDVFMRSMASRGELGGIAATTWIAAAALDAAGYDPVLIETVGAGQSEVEVARLAETTLVVEVPEMGDEVQAIKAGLLEVADIIAVNKGDRPGADRAARQLRAMLSTAGGRVERKPPPVLVTTATTTDGVTALADAIEAHRSQARSPLQARERAASQVRRALADLAVRHASTDAMVPLWGGTLDRVAAREVDPMTAAESLLDGYYWTGFETKRSDEGERLEQAIHGGLALTRFEDIAKFIEDAVERGDWYQPSILMDDLFFSDQLEELLPEIEERARSSRAFRQQLVFSARGGASGGRGGAAAERFRALAAEFGPEFDSGDAQEPSSPEA
ncbi:MAG: methylmalonyl Co-A mutase-associated GTPase MeaB [Chloroflexota bacterium]